MRVLSFYLALIAASAAFTARGSHDPRRNKKRTLKRQGDLNVGDQGTDERAEFNQLWESVLGSSLLKYDAFVILRS